MERKMPYHPLLTEYKCLSITANVLVKMFSFRASFQKREELFSHKNSHNRKGDSNSKSPGTFCLRSSDKSSCRYCANLSFMWCENFFNEHPAVHKCFINNSFCQQIFVDDRLRSDLRTKVEMERKRECFVCEVIFRSLILCFSVEAGTTQCTEVCKNKLW